MTKPRILFMGTPAFAVPALEGLVRSGWPVIGVVTQPDRPQGRGRTLAPPPVKIVAEGLGLPVLQPEKVRHPDFLETFRKLAPDLVVVAAFGQILPGEIIHGPKRGLHQYPPLASAEIPGGGADPPGPDPRRGDDRRHDHADGRGGGFRRDPPPGGDADRSRRRISASSTTAWRSWARTCSACAGDAALRNASAAPPGPQPGDRRPPHRPRGGPDRLGSDCRQIVSLIRGLSPVPCAYTFLGRKTAQDLRGNGGTGDRRGGAGNRRRGDRRRPPRRRGERLCSAKEVQLEGKKRMAIRDFLRGCPVAPGQILG